MNTDRKDHQLNLCCTKRQEFYDWCEQNNIKVEYQGTTVPSKYAQQKLQRNEKEKPFDSWYIENDKDRMLAILRWS